MTYVVFSNNDGRRNRRAEEDGSQLTVSIRMNGFHKEGIPRVQAFLQAGSGVLWACRIQACNEIKGCGPVKVDTEEGHKYGQRSGEPLL